MTFHARGVGLPNHQPSKKTPRWIWVVGVLVAVCVFSGLAWRKLHEKRTLAALDLDLTPASWEGPLTHKVVRTVEVEGLGNLHPARQWKFVVASRRMNEKDARLLAEEFHKEFPEYHIKVVDSDDPQGLDLLEQRLQPLSNPVGAKQWWRVHGQLEVHYEREYDRWEWVYWHGAGKSTRSKPL